MAATLKFICLNLWNGGRLFDHVLAFLRAEQADIIALQEVNNGHDPAWDRRFRSLDVLLPQLPYPYHAFSPAFLEMREPPHVDNGNAILSRFPINNNREVFFDIPYGPYTDPAPGDYTHVPRNLQHAEVDFHGITLNVFNAQGIWGFDGNDHERRLAMGATIAAAVAGKPRVILAGDFNVQEGTKTTDLIEQQLTPVFKKDKRVSSFNINHKTGGGYGTAVVDMVFVSPDIRVVHHEQSDADVSDHKALVCAFEIDTV